MEGEFASFALGGDLFPRIQNPCFVVRCHHGYGAAGKCGKVSIQRELCNAITSELPVCAVANGRMLYRGNSNRLGAIGKKAHDCIVCLRRTGCENDALRFVATPEQVREVFPQVFQKQAGGSCFPIQTGGIVPVLVCYPQPLFLRRRGQGSRRVVVEIFGIFGHEQNLP